MGIWSNWRRIDYPILMSTGDGCVVLFVGKTLGMVVGDGGGFKIGDFRSDWDITAFDAHKSTVKMKNI